MKTVTAAEAIMVDVSTDRPSTMKPSPPPSPSQSSEPAIVPGSKRVRGIGEGKQWESIAKAIQADGLLVAMDIATPGFVLKNLSLCRNYAAFVAAKRIYGCPPPVVLWFFGTTGTGKSATAYELGYHLMAKSEPYVLVPQKEIKWFQGYAQERVCILDELRPSMIEMPFLLRLLDRYPLQLEVKGGSTHFSSSVVIITTDRDPRSFYDAQGCIDQLLRRLSLVVHFGEHRVTKLTTSLAPSCKTSWEVPSSWTSLDSVGCAVSGKAPVFVLPASTDFMDDWLAQEGLDLVTNFDPDLFLEDNFDDPFHDPPRLGRSLISVLGKTTRSKTLDREFEYRCLKFDEDECAREDVNKL